MPTCNDVCEGVITLYVKYKRPVSIDEIADFLGTSSSVIRQFVVTYLQLGILEGAETGLQPGPAMGLYS